MSYPHYSPSDHAKNILILSCLTLHSISLPNFQILNCLFGILNTCLLVIPHPYAKFLAIISQPNTVSCPSYHLFPILVQQIHLLKTQVSLKLHCKISLELYQSPFTVPPIATSLFHASVLTLTSYHTLLKAAPSYRMFC
jgi:hypothetical protein